MTVLVILNSMVLCRVGLWKAVSLSRSLVLVCLGAGAIVMVSKLGLGVETQPDAVSLPTRRALPSCTPLFLLLLLLLIPPIPVAGVGVLWYGVSWTGHTPFPPSWGIVM